MAAAALSVAAALTIGACTLAFAGESASAGVRPNPLDGIGPATTAPGAPAPGVRTRQPSAATFTFRVTTISAAERRAMIPSVWRRGCPVPMRDLRVVRLAHWTFGGTVTQGALVVHRAVAADVVRTFSGFFDVRFPIRRMSPIEEFGGSDYASIEADNTSAFNCRAVTGGKRWSNHAYGRAIDINPLENPYVSNGRTSHRASVAFLQRRPTRRGMLVANTPALAVVDAVGWDWGGRWRNGPRDYQHIAAR